MSNYAQHVTKSGKKAGVNADATQMAKADPRQVKNNAGGFTFEVDRWKQLDRFLVLGAEGGTYHSTEKKLVRENAKALTECLADDAAAAIEQIAAVSESGRAPKNSPAIFALAIAASHGDVVVRRLALAALPRVCRTGTHLFEFIDQVEQLRGWGSALKRAVAAWYTSRDPGSLAYQLVKYQQRNGRSHRDVMRQAHPKSDDTVMSALFRWVVAGSLDERSIQRKDQAARAHRRHAAGVDSLSAKDFAASLTERQPALSRDGMPGLIGAFETIRKPDVDYTTLLKLIREHRLTHEMVPSQFLGKPETWDALLDSMPMHALVRNLGRMTANGLLTPKSDASKRVIDKLTNYDAIKKSRLHPFAVLLALRTYAQGHGEKGTLTWSAVKPIVDALDSVFYTAFESVESTGKSHLLALDISGSMDSPIMNSCITHREAVAVMAMVTARVEESTHMIGFTSGGGRGAGAGAGTTPINITKSTKLEQALQIMRALPMGSTDCSQPMLYALEGDKTFEAFCVYTDNETYAGKVHPHIALQRYRQKTNIPAKLVVVATAASPFTIADPTDAGMLDVVGMDAAAPAVIADFIRG